MPVDAIVAALFGAMFGWAANHFLPGLWRRVTRQPLVYIHVETDPAVIWAGAPPWIGANYVIADPHGLGRPPTPFCPDWYKWLKNKGGIPALQTEAEITITAPTDLTIVLDGVRARVVRREHPPSGVHLQCAVGGADITPRHIRIELDTFDPPTSSFVNVDGALVRAPKVTLTKSEAEKWHIVAEAQHEYIEWTAELLAIVNGKRRIFTVDNHGKPFQTCGVEGLPKYLWNGVAWEPQLPS